MQANNEAESLRKILKEGYDVPLPDASFVQHLAARLRERLVQEGGQPPSGARSVILRHPRVVAAVAAAVVIGVGLFLVGGFLGNGDGPVTRPAVRWVEIDTSPPLGSWSFRYFRFPPLAMRVGHASAIVRCKMVEMTEAHLVCEVTRVIYGRLPGDVLHVEGVPGAAEARQTLRSTLKRDPTEEEVKAEILRMSGFEPGIERDVILFVDNVREGDEAVVCRYLGASYNVPPRHPLDEEEREIVEVIKRGAHLTPAIEDLDRYVCSCDTIVRAKLKKVGETAAEWEVSSVLYLAPDSEPFQPLPKDGDIARESAGLIGKTIRVGLDPWRLRAETIVNYRPDEAGAAKKPDDKKAAKEKRIQKEFERLLAAELHVGREAILFVRTPLPAAAKVARECVLHKLVGILHADPKQPDKIDDIEEKTRKMIEKGVHRTIYVR